MSSDAAPWPQVMGPMPIQQSDTMSKMLDGDSPFLAVPSSEWLAVNRSAFVIADRLPVSPGHALVVPRRLITSWWEATNDEREDILALVDKVKHQLATKMQPDGYNVGFNV